jgi:hypothetical protein
MRLAEFNATYGSTEVFEARIQESEIAFENCLSDLKDAVLEALFAASLLQHTPRMALGYAWDYQIKHQRSWMEENLEFEITNDLFTLDVDALREGKVRFVPCEGVTIKDMHRRTL